MSYNSGSGGNSTTGGGPNNSSSSSSGNYYYSNSGRGGVNSGGGAGGRRPRSPSPNHRHPQQQPYMSRARHSPPRRPPYRRRRDEMPYTIPNIAPRLHVPHDLPVDVTAFLDLVAFYIVQGGPTAEEEIMKREENNPHFAFLHNPWHHPMQLYYRWRLYSLLQGDTLLKWRTEPFQIERGNDAYVWVPPPAISSGPECLLNVFAQEELRKSRTGSTSSGGNIKSTVAADTDKDAGASSSSGGTLRPIASASWLSRMCVSEGAFFVTLEKSAAVEWQQLLCMEHHLAEAWRRGQTLEERLGALTGVLLDRELIAQRMVFAVEHQHAALHLMSLALDEVLRLAYEAAVAVDDVGDGRSGAVHINAKKNSNTSSNNSGHGANNTVNNNNNNIGDECALRAAARCCMCLSYLFTLNDIGKNGTATPLTGEELANMAPLWEVPDGVHVTNSTGNPSNGHNLNTAGIHSNTSSSSPVGATAPHADEHPFLSSGLLPLPSPLNTSSSLSSSPSTTATATTTTTGGGGGGGGGTPLRLLNRALEKIIPTLIEATLIVALCTVQQYGSLTVDNARETARSSAKPPGAEEIEGILPLDIDHAAYVHVQARLTAARTVGTGANVAGTHTGATAAVMNVRKEDRDAVCMIALLLISWLKQLCASWAEGDVIGSRCWSTLLTKYVCLLSQPIETTMSRSTDTMATSTGSVGDIPLCNASDADMYTTTTTTATTTTTTAAAGSSPIALHRSRRSAIPIRANKVTPIRVNKVTPLHGTKANPICINSRLTSRVVEVLQAGRPPFRGPSSINRLAPDARTTPPAAPPRRHSQHNENHRSDGHNSEGWKKNQNNHKGNNSNMNDNKRRSSSSTTCASTSADSTSASISASGSTAAVSSLVVPNRTTTSTNRAPMALPPLQAEMFLAPATDHTSEVYEREEGGTGKEAEDLQDPSPHEQQQQQQQNEEEEGRQQTTSQGHTDTDGTIPKSGSYEEAHTAPLVLTDVRVSCDRLSTSTHPHSTTADVVTNTNSAISNPTSAAPSPSPLPSVPIMAPDVLEHEVYSQPSLESFIHMPPPRPKRLSLADLPLTCEPLLLPRTAAPSLLEEGARRREKSAPLSIPHGVNDYCVPPVSEEGDVPAVSLPLKTQQQQQHRTRREEEKEDRRGSVKYEDVRRSSPSSTAWHEGPSQAVGVAVDALHTPGSLSRPRTLLPPSPLLAPNETTTVLVVAREEYKNKTKVRQTQSNRNGKRSESCESNVFHEPIVVRVFAPRHVLDDVTVLDLKMEVQRLIGVTAAEQTLCADGVELIDDVPLAFLDPDTVLFMEKRGIKDTAPSTQGGDETEGRTSTGEQRSDEVVLKSSGSTSSTITPVPSNNGASGVMFQEGLVKALKGTAKVPHVRESTSGMSDERNYSKSNKFNDNSSSSGGGNNNYSYNYNYNGMDMSSLKYNRPHVDAKYGYSNGMLCYNAPHESSTRAALSAKRGNETTHYTHDRNGGAGDAEVPQRGQTHYHSPRPHQRNECLFPKALVSSPTGGVQTPARLFTADWGNTRDASPTLRRRLEAQESSMRRRQRELLEEAMVAAQQQVELLVWLCRQTQHSSNP